MTGKEKCRLLGAMRREIARHNGIALEERACTHRGDCPGTCPRCEGEARALEQALHRRAALGKRVALVGLCAGMVMAGSGCAVTRQPPTPTPIVDSQLTGMVAPTPPPVDIIETTGDVAYDGG